VTDCVFCPANWPNLDVVQREHSSFLIFRPLDPVTDGHVLVVSRHHTANASISTQDTANIMGLAARYVREQGIEANIITSIGSHATQTVMHTHVHVVPRRENDGLPLPWTPQHELKKLHAIQALQQIAQESRLDNYSHGIFQQQSPPSWLNGAAAAAHGYIEKITGGDGGPLMRPSNPYLATEGLGYDDSDD